ncbi:MAG: septum formation protein Maf, partial [Bacteroidetes bacterium]
MLPLKLPYRIILGSQSPRRVELLKMMDIEFDIVVSEADENYPLNISPFIVPEYLAKKKNEEVWDKLEQEKSNCLVITCDTIVLLPDTLTILEKPQDENHAFEIIKQLSGRKHNVISGVCVATQKENLVFSDITEVQFRDLSHEEIRYYISRYKPFDKAGAYGVQEWIGVVGIESVNGSFYNVMGLPTEKLYQVLRNEFSLK